ncbi:MAG: hypothetical protein IPK79_09910 [Vampirovibrionales bacterium]|nr:hypothetical protein [Vampirovibrionales bacterium]
MAIQRIKPASVNSASHVAGGGMGRAADRASNVLHRFFEAPSQILREGQEFRLATEQIPLAAAAGSALLYIEGQERARPAGDPTLWARLLGEAGLIYGLMTYTSGVLPLIALGTLAWKMGQGANDNSKLKSALTVAGSMSLGYLGAMTGLRYTMTSADRETGKLLPLLRDPSVRSFFAQDSDAALHALGDDLARENPTLRAGLKEMGGHIDNSLPLLEHSRGFLSAEPLTAQSHRMKLSQELGKIQAPLNDPALEGYFARLSQGVSEKLAQHPFDVDWQARQRVMRRVRELANRLTDSQKYGYQLIRAANPLFGALIGMLAGLSLANGLYGFIRKRAPRLAAILPGQVNATPLWLSNRANNGGDVVMPRLSHLNVGAI